MPVNMAADIENVFKDCSFGLDLWETIQFFAALVYGSLSILLYALEIRLILKTAKLEHPFYFQFIYLSIMVGLLRCPSPPFSRISASGCVCL